MATVQKLRTDIFCGELDLRQVALEDARDVAHFLQHVRSFSHGQGAETVRSLDVRGLRLSVLSTREFGLLLACVERFCNLERMRVDRCFLDHARVLSLLNVAKDMQNFEYPVEDVGIFDPTSRARVLSEIHLGHNGVEDSTVSDLFGQAGKKLAGVGVLSLTNCSITDASVVPLCELFPSLTKLFLSSTLVEGATLAVAIKALTSLRVLGLDGSRVSGPGCSNILEALLARSKMPDRTPLEVWLRGVAPVDERWNKLLEFSSSAKNASTFVIKHDLQVPMAVRPRHVVKVYGLVTMKLHISNLGTFAIPYHRVVSSKSIMKMAKEAVDELNLVAMGDEKDVQDRLVMKRRSEYREVFADLFASGYFVNKTFVVGVVQFTSVNKFTGKRKMTYEVDGALLGAPDRSCSYEIDVEAEQVDRVQLNSEGARVMPRLV